MFKISIVIPNYNGKKIIKECVDSVLNSNYPSFEIVVVENASTDGSYEILKKNYGNNERVKIVKSDKQLYFVGGCNLGARKSSGEKLIFLNSDTTVDKDWLTELVAFTGRREKLLIQPKILSYWQKDVIDNVGGNYSFFGFGSGRGHGEKDNGQFDKNTQTDFANGTCFMIDKKFFEELGGFDEWYKYYYEDVDLNLRAKKHGGESWYCYKSVIHHKGSLTFKGNVRSENLLFNIRKNRLRTLIKNSSGLERIVKIFGLLLVYVFLTLHDVLTLKPKRMFLTPKSVRAVLDYEYKFLIEKIRLRELLSFVKQKKFRLLDLGCGDASFLKVAEEKGLDILGVDKSPVLHPKVITTSIESLKLDKKFDVVTLFHVLEHIEKPQSVLEKVKDFLKEEGTLVVEVPLVGNLTEKVLRRDYFAYYDKTHINFFTKEEILKLLSNAGLEIKKKGFTLLEFPFTVLTTNFRKGFLRGLLGIGPFLPLKILSVLGWNDEIIRLYCAKKS